MLGFLLVGDFSTTQPWIMTHTAITLVETQKVRVHIISLEPLAALEKHFHTYMSESVTCLEGTVCVRAETVGLEAILSPGQSVTIHRGVPHQIRNLAEAPSQYLSMQNGGDYDFFALTK